MQHRANLPEQLLKLLLLGRAQVELRLALTGLLVHRLASFHADLLPRLGEIQLPTVHQPLDHLGLGCLVGHLVQIEGSTDRTVELASTLDERREVGLHGFLDWATHHRVEGVVQCLQLSLVQLQVQATVVGADIQQLATVALQQHVHGSDQLLERGV